MGRETYAELFAAIGTTFGEGDGETSFNLPDLIDRFAQGSAAPGQKVEAGLPNVTGNASNIMVGTHFQCSGAFSTTVEGVSPTYGGTTSAAVRFNFSADKSNPIYGASDTVQPPALTLLPCIKAFDAATNPGLIDITGLANEVDGKLDRVIDSKPVRYVIDAYNDGTNWYRNWSDGWVELGGRLAAANTTITITFLLPFSDDNYCIFKNLGSAGGIETKPSDYHVSFYNLSALTAQTTQYILDTYTRWYACGY